MAGAAPGTRRQAHGPGLLIALALAACAKLGDPPGGPPDTTPPTVVAVRPESGAVVPDFHGDAVVQFDEVIDERAGGTGGGAGGGGGGGAPAGAVGGVGGIGGIGGVGGGGGAVGGLGRQVVLSPVAGEVKVSWHRAAIHLRPVEGWRPGRVYRLELLPGIADLRRNVIKQSKTVIFSTGPAIGHAVLTGTALQWVEQRTLVGGVIRAARLPDTVAYVTVADSAGDFRLPELEPGRYRVLAIQDQNGNRALDRREAFDTATVTLDTAAHLVLWTFMHDSAGPRLRTADPLDSTSFRLSFSQPLDPAMPLDTARVRVLALPDSTPVAVTAVLTPAAYDSLTARESARADSLRRAADTTAKRDTTGPPRAPNLAQAVAAAQAGAAATPARPAPPAGSAADTSRIRRLLRQRPAPFDRLVVRVREKLLPGSKYLIRARGATNLNGAAADGQAVLAIPVPKPARAPRDTAPAPPPTPRRPGPPKPP